jgi:hypothetical protein
MWHARARKASQISELGILMENREWVGKLGKNWEFSRILRTNFYQEFLTQEKLGMIRSVESQFMESQFFWQIFSQMPDSQFFAECVKDPSLTQNVKWTDAFEMMSRTSSHLARTLIVHNDPWGTHKMRVTPCHHIPGAQTERCCQNIINISNYK